MNEDQEIRAKALEIAVQTFAMLPQDAKMRFLSDGDKIQQTIINASRIFEEHIKGAKP